MRFSAEKTYFSEDPVTTVPSPIDALPTLSTQENNSSYPILSQTYVVKELSAINKPKTTTPHSLTEEELEGCLDVFGTLFQWQKDLLSGRDAEENGERYDL